MGCATENEAAVKAKGIRGTERFVDKALSNTHTIATQVSGESNLHRSMSFRSEVRLGRRASPEGSERRESQRNNTAEVETLLQLRNWGNRGLCNKE
jgi:hypothetical protein